MKRCLSVLTTLLILAGWLTACAKPAEPPTPVEVPPDTTMLQWSVWGGASTERVFEQLVSTFEAQHPDVRVQLVSVADYLNYITKLETLIASNAAPDVIMIAPGVGTDLALMGALADLNPYVEADPDVSTDDFIPIVLQSLSYEGMIYALPKDFGVDVLYYNKNAFDAAGLDYPDDTWTWDTLLSAAQALTVRDDSGRVVQWGWTDSALNMWPWVWQNGGDVFDDPYKPTRVMLCDPPVLEAVEFYYSLSLEHQVAPDVAELQQTPFRELFMAGRVAMIYDIFGSQLPFSEITAFEWDVAPLAQGAQRATPLATAGYAMSATTPHADLAWELIKFLAGSEAVKVVAQAGGGMPARVDLLDAPDILIRPAFRDSIAYARPHMAAPHFLEMMSIYRAHLPIMAMGIKSVPDSLNEMCDQVNAILKQ